MTLYFNYWTLISFSFLISTSLLWHKMPSWEWLYPCILTLLLSIRSKRLRWFIGPVLGSAVLIIHGNLLRDQHAWLFQAGQDITIKAEVDSFFKKISHGFQGEIVIRAIGDENTNILAAPRALFVSPVRLHPGDEIGGQVILKPMNGQLNDVGFDVEQYALQRRIVGRLSLKRNTHYWVRHFGSQRYEFYRRVADRIEPLVGKGFILALAFGVRDALTAEQRLELKASGLSHLIAISGLHIGIVSYIGWVLGRGLLRLLPMATWTPYLLALLTGFGYAWLAGFALPTQRALWSMCLALILLTSNRQIPYSYTWLLILAWLLAIDPFSAVSTSLWLSMGAVGVIFVYLSLTHTDQPQWKTSLGLQMVLMVGMTPIIAMSFDGMSLSSVIYNLVFVPWFSFVVVPTVLLALTVDGLYHLTWVWTLADKTIQPVLWAIQFADVSWINLNRNQIRLLLLVSLAALLAPYLSKKGHFSMIACMLAVGINWRPSSDWQVTVLDVGHGLAIVVIQGDRAIVYDTGIAWKNSSFAQQIITPYLFYEGVRQLDMLIISHGDKDHSGGMQSMIDVWQPEALITSQRNLGSQSCVQGRDIDWHGLKLAFIWPPRLVTRAYNPQSCVVRISHPDYKQSVLLTGDINRMVEWMLIRDPDALRSQILIVPHHGSKTSSLLAFIQAVDPELAIASTAKFGRWRLPDESIVKRYQKQGIQWLDTGSHGQITIRFSSSGWEVEALRGRKGEAWYRQMLRKGVE